MNRRLEIMLGSKTKALIQKAKEMKRKDPGIIALDAGEPDFSTPDRISMATIRSLSQGNTHYGGGGGVGVKELREAIAKKLHDENKIAVDAKHIIVTPGAKYAIYTAVNSLLNEGDEAMILEPSWLSYRPIVQTAGAVPVGVSLDRENGYKITRAVLDRSVTEKTRLLLINYPNNPTGCVLHEDEADIIEQFLLEHPDIYVISDEIYEAIVFDGLKNVSLGARPDIARRVVTVNGFSKCVAMTGWRLGYLAAPDDLFIKCASSLFRETMTCSCGFLQRGALEAFKCGAEIEEMRKTYQHRRDMFIGALNKIDGVQCQIPQGAFYAWTFFNGLGMTSTEMFSYLLHEYKVFGIPGTEYGDQEHCCIRFSFATSDHILAEAAERIGKAVAALREKARS